MIRTGIITSKGYIDDLTGLVVPATRVVDITVKNNPTHILAPTWAMVMGLKASLITWEEYVQQYVELVMTRVANGSRLLFELAEKSDNENVVLVCFCEDKKRCHRSLAENLLKTVRNWQLGKRC